MRKKPLRDKLYVERRHMNFVVRRINEMEGSQTTRGKGRPRKIMRETTEMDLGIEINDLEIT